MKPMVINRHRWPKGVKCKDCVYVGRGSRWGNKFKIGEHGTREEVIARYKQWLAGSPELWEGLWNLRGKHLVCYCAPLACHADVLLMLASLPRHRLRNYIDRGDYIREW